MYKKAHLMAGGEKKMERALKEYEKGKPWEFKQSKGLMKTVKKGNDDGFRSPFMIPMGGGGQKQAESAKRADNEEPTKTFDERIEENADRFFSDPNYQKYLASAFQE
jgi:hypothetical protein